MQVAKHLGARVTAVCSPQQVELVRSLGADEVVDYLQEDWTRSGTYDGVLDAVGKSSFRKARRALNPGAAYVVRRSRLSLASAAADPPDALVRQPQGEARAGALPAGGP